MLNLMPQFTEKRDSMWSNNFVWRGSSDLGKKIAVRNVCSFLAICHCRVTTLQVDIAMKRNEQISHQIYGFDETLCRNMSRMVLDAKKLIKAYI